MPWTANRSRDIVATYGGWRTPPPGTGVESSSRQSPTVRACENGTNRTESRTASSSATSAAVASAPGVASITRPVSSSSHRRWVPARSGHGAGLNGPTGRTSPIGSVHSPELSPTQGMLAAAAYSRYLASAPAKGLDVGLVTSSPGVAARSAARSTGPSSRERSRIDAAEHGSANVWAANWKEIEASPLIISMSRASQPAGTVNLMSNGSPHTNEVVYVPESSGPGQL